MGKVSDWSMVDFVMLWTLFISCYYTGYYMGITKDKL